MIDFYSLERALREKTDFQLETRCDSVSNDPAPGALCRFTAARRPGYVAEPIYDGFITIIGGARSLHAKDIVVAWIITTPMAAFIAATCYALARIAA